MTKVARLFIFHIYFIMLSLPREEHFYSPNDLGEARFAGESFIFLNFDQT